MDSITDAIVAAAPFVADKVGGHLVADAYGMLKGWIKKQFGEQHAVVEAMNKVEQTPTEGRKLTLHEEVVACGLAQYEEALQLARNLESHLKSAGITVIHNTINVNTANNSTIIGSQHNHR